MDEVEAEAAAVAEETRAAWREVLHNFHSLMTELWKEIGEDRVISVAAGVTFYAVLAMVPAISVLVSLFGLVTDPSDSQGIFETASDFLPEEAAVLLTEQAVRIASKANESLSLAAMVALVLALWTANNGTRALIEALVIARDEEDPRGFVRLNLLSMGFTLGALVVLIFLSVVVATLPVLLDWVGLGSKTEILLLTGRWPFVVTLLMFALAVFYRWAPPREKGPPRWLSPGVVLATILLIACSSGFGWYVGSFGSYDETYGSLAAVAVTMMWLWLSTVSVLIGAEVDAILEKRAHPPGI